MESSYKGAVERRMGERKEERRIIRGGGRHDGMGEGRLWVDGR